MAPILVGIDLGQSHFRIGALVLSKYIVTHGTKDIKVNGPQSPDRGQVVEVFHDAKQVVKSFFGAPNFQAAVVVVPNSTSHQNREAIAAGGRSVGYNIVQVINEHIAVAAAYAEIVKPTSNKRVAIVSVTGGILDVSIISVEDGFEFVLEARETHLEPIEFQEESKHSGPGGLVGFVGGVVGGAVKTLVVDPLDKVFDVVKKLLSSPKLGESAVDEVIFVGKASKSEKLKQAVKERFPNARVWSPPEEIGIGAEELAAYGAGVIAYKQKSVERTRPVFETEEGQTNNSEDWIKGVEDDPSQEPVGEEGNEDYVEETDLSSKKSIASVSL